MNVCSASYAEDYKESCSMKNFAIAFALVASASTSVQADWRPEMDLLSAGAASSVVAMHSCKGEVFSNSANQYASTKLRRAAMSMLDSEEAYAYAQHAFEIKVPALWQSTGGSCSNARRLIDIARSTGFLVPNIN